MSTIDLSCKNIFNDRDVPCGCSECTTFDEDFDNNNFFDNDDFFDLEFYEQDPTHKNNKINISFTPDELLYIFNFVKIAEKHQPCSESLDFLLPLGDKLWIAIMQNKILPKTKKPGG